MPARFADLADALVIPVPDDPALVLDGCRRLLGPNLYSDRPGAVGDGLCPGFDPGDMLDRWQGHTGALLGALGWQATITTRPFDGGASLFIPAPADRLMTAAYLVEGAWHFTACEMLGHAPWSFDRMTAELTRIAAMEANPPLLRLLAAADAQGIDRLLDDDAVTLGHGAGAQTFDAAHLPETPDWAALHDIPLALVTGTNGKTTTTRLIAAMGQAAGRVSGLSSTEFVRVGDDILDRGDYSGPAGARLLLRDPRVELGVLEVARGGILRRGLPVTRARAAVVTNVAADHLGQYGINTVAELAQVKLAVRRGLAPGGWLILNAGDPMLVQTAKALGLAPSGDAPDGGNGRHPSPPWGGDGGGGLGGTLPAQAPHAPPGDPPTPTLPTRGREGEAVDAGALPQGGDAHPARGTALGLLPVPDAHQPHLPSPLWGGDGGRGLGGALPAQTPQGPPGDPPTPALPTRGREGEAVDAGALPQGGGGQPQRVTALGLQSAPDANQPRLPSPSWGGDGGGGADDRLPAQAPEDDGFTGQVVWFALDPDGAQIRAARAAGQPCGWLQDGHLILSDGQRDCRLIAAAEVPLTLGGAARYNIENALGAALAARALGLPDAAIRATLASFRSDPTDNPGRANEFDVKGARVFVDFAHNPHSIAAVTSALAALPAKRRFVLIMHAGDRSDEDIRALTTGAFALRPDYVVAAENPKYLRGRQLGEIPALIRATSTALGLPADHVLIAPSPTAGAGAILDRLRPGDLALLLVHAERDEIFDLIAAAQTPATPV